MIWYMDPVNIFLKKDNAIQFIPNNSMSLVQQLNAAIRFVLYFSLLMLLIDPKQFINSLSLCVVVALVTVLIYVNDTHDNVIKNKIMEHLNIQFDANEEVGSKPTKENPFMNFMFDDHINFPSKKAADPLSVDVQKQIQIEFDKNQFRDVDDVFNRQNSSRQFYTMPCTTVVNDRESFMKACYNLPKTRKEDSIQTWATLKDKYVA